MGTQVQARKGVVSGLSLTDKVDEVETALATDKGDRSAADALSEMDDEDVRYLAQKGPSGQTFVEAAREAAAPRTLSVLLRVLPGYTRDGLPVDHRTHPGTKVPDRHL